MVKNPPTREEVDRVTSQLLRGLENSLSNAQAIATGALNIAIAQGDWRLMFLQHDRLQDIVPADVVRVAKTYFKPSNRTVGYYIPDRAPDRTVVPAAPDLDDTFRNYTSKVSVVRGETFDPTIANIESRDRPLEAAEWDEGGRPARRRPPTTWSSATIDLRFGDAHDAGGRARSGVVCRRAADVGHEEPQRAQQIQEELRKLNAQVSRRAVAAEAAGADAADAAAARVAADCPARPRPCQRPRRTFAAALRLAVEMLKRAGLSAGRFRSDQDAADEGAWS